MISSGETAVATASNASVTLIAAVAGQFFQQLVIVNEGSVAGYFSIDGGATWGRLPASARLDLSVRIENQAVTIKRITDGSNLADVYGFML